MTFPTLDSNKKELSNHPTFTKHDAILMISKLFHIHKNQAASFINTIFEEISQTLEQEEEFKMLGFGNFKVVQKAQRPGLNPKTREKHIVSARKVVSFHPKHSLKEALRKIKP